MTFTSSATVDAFLSSPGVAKTEAKFLSLADLGTQVRVVELVLEADLAAWLRAVGIGEGEKLVVLRRAAFGGPIHVRTSSGGEFALNRSLASSIVIRHVDE